MVPKFNLISLRLSLRLVFYLIFWHENLKFFHVSKSITFTQVQQAFRMGAIVPKIIRKDWVSNDLHMLIKIIRIKWKEKIQKSQVLEKIRQSGVQHIVQSVSGVASVWRNKKSLRTDMWEKDKIQRQWWDLIGRGYWSRNRKRNQKINGGD